MRDILLFLIIFGSLPFILIMPWIGILMWYWIGLMNPHRLGWSFITDMPVAMGVGLVTLGALFLTRDRLPIPKTREMILLGLFAAYVTMTTFYAWNPGAAWTQWEKFMKILLITFVTPMLIYGRTRTVLLLLVIAASIGFYGFKGGIFSINTGGQYAVMGPLRSFIGDRNSLGLALIMSLPLILVTARMFRERWVDLGILTRWPLIAGYFTYAVFWLTFIATLFTYSRGALVGLLPISILLFIKMQRKWVVVSLVLLIIGVIGFTFPDRLVERWQTIETYEQDRSAMQRLQAWGVNWNIAVAHPIMGSGFNNHLMPNHVWLSYANWIEPWAAARRAAHSIYFQVLGHHGLGGFAIYMAIVICTLLTLNRIRRTAKTIPGNEWLSEYAWAIQISIAGYMAAGAFLDLAYFDLFYALVALAVIMQRELEAQLAQNTHAQPVDQPAKARQRRFVRTDPSPELKRELDSRP